MGRRLDAVRGFWIDRIWLDYLIAGLPVGLYYVGVVSWSWLDVFSWAAPTDRRSVYSAAAVVVSLLGSFSSVAIGQLSSARGERADLLRRAGGRDLSRNWRSVFRAALLCALVALGALLVDPSSPDSAGCVSMAFRWLFQVSLALAVVRFVRLSALFVDVLDVASSDGEVDVNREVPSPVVDPKWESRRGGR